MSPNPRGKLEDLAAGCVCCLVVCVEPSGVQALKNPNPLKDVEASAVLV